MTQMACSRSCSSEMAKWKQDTKNSGVWHLVKREGLSLCCCPGIKLPAIYIIQILFIHLEQEGQVASLFHMIVFQKAASVYSQYFHPR